MSADARLRSSWDLRVVVVFQRCPAVANVNEEAFSSCSVDFHCPGDEICCPNKGTQTPPFSSEMMKKLGIFPGGHFHCSEAVAAVIAGGNTTTLPKDNLAKVCSDHSPTWSFELALSASNHNCTQDSPDSCPVSTLCCNEKCYGFYANDDLAAIQLSDFKCQGSLLCQGDERCLGLKEFGKECSLKGKFFWHCLMREIIQCHLLKRYCNSQVVSSWVPRKFLQNFSFGKRPKGIQCHSGKWHNVIDQPCEVAGFKTRIFRSVSTSPGSNKDVYWKSKSITLFNIIQVVQWKYVWV